MIGGENGSILCSDNDGNTWEDSFLLLIESIIGVGFNYTSPESSIKYLATGIYFYTLRAGDPFTSSGLGFVQTKKMIYLK